jgi:CRP-like cAMP-binding protein
MALPIKSENQLLERLSEADLKLLTPHLKPLGMDVHYEFELPNKPIKHVYFMDSGFASVVATSPHTSVEVGLIGKEGMSGVAILMGNHRSPHAVYIQAAGKGHRISVGHLRKAIKASETMQMLFLKYVQSFMIQTSHTAICNARAHIGQRLARWILMAHDRLGSAALPITHQFFALMLGVRRAGVTEALHILEGEGLVQSLRGQVIVVNRKGLERKAGDFYGVPEAEYRRLIG